MKTDWPSETLIENKWSDVLLDNYSPDPDIFKSLEPQIREYNMLILRGKAPFLFAPKLPNLISNKTSREYLANMFMCMPSDIDIILKED